MNLDELKEQSIGALLDSLPDEVPGINETPELKKVRHENALSVRDDKAKSKAKKTIEKLLKFYLTEDIIEQNEYILAKSEIDEMSLGMLLKQMENSERAIQSLMNTIDEGDVSPRLYEVLSELQRTQLDIIKTQTMHLVAVEENAKKIQREAEIFAMQREMNNENNSDDKESTNSTGGAKVRGGRDLMIALNRSINEYEQNKDTSEAEYVPPEAPEYVAVVEEESRDTDDDVDFDE